MNSTVVHRHTTSENGFAVNSYLLEARDAVIAVDAPFLLSDARSFRALFDGLRKPLAGVLVTHAHPDHVNGITTLVDGLADVPVVATAGVAAVHHAIDAPKRAQWAPVHGVDYPPVATFPDRLVQDGESILLGGSTFTVRDLGAGESPSGSIWLLEGDDRSPVFIGDLAYNHVHPYLMEPQSAAWLAQLAEAPGLLPEGALLHPGHGAPGDATMLDRQIVYLELFRSEVARLADGAFELTEGAREELEKTMVRHLPSAPLEMLIGLNTGPVAAELRAERDSPARSWSATWTSGA